MKNFKINHDWLKVQSDVMVNDIINEGYLKELSYKETEDLMTLITSHLYESYIVGKYTEKRR